jgi:hypothetical protein
LAPAPAGLDSSSSVDALVPVLARAYGDAYAEVTGDAWLSWDAVRREITTCARWVLRQAATLGEDPPELARRWMLAAWARCGGRVPKWDFLAKDPASYLRDAPAPMRDREAIANRIGELKAEAEHIRTQAERLERMGKRDSAQPLRVHLSKIWQERQQLEGVSP